MRLPIKPLLVRAATIVGTIALTIVALYFVATSTVAQQVVVIFGLNSGAPKAITVDASGNVNFKCISGCGSVGGSPTQVQYNNSGALGGISGATSNGTIISFVETNIGVVSTDGATIQNGQAAAVGAQQWSPRLHFIGSGWKTNATAGPQTIDFIQEVQIVQGSASPVPQLTWSYQRNGAGYNISAQMTDAAGQTTGNIGYLQLNIGAAGNGSIAPISTADHVNMTRGGSSGVTLGFGTFNSSADLGQLGIAISGMTGVSNAPTYTSVGASNTVGVGTGDASGSNIAGGNTTVFGGRSTGSGAGGSIVFQTTPATGSSSTLNTATTALTIDSAGHLNNPQNFGAPSCSSNCGTSPSVAGGDLNGIVTMGGTGVPASGWVLTFAKAFAAAPSCSVTAALTTMVVGKIAVSVQTSTTTMTVTTNGTAPGNSDKYAYDCKGVQ